MKPYTYKISLRMFHGSHDLTDVYEKISQIYGPGKLKKLGEPLVLPSGKTMANSSAGSYCYVNVLNDEEQNSEDRSVFETIEMLADQLYEQKELLSQISALGGSASFFVGWHIDGSSADTIQPKLMKKLLELSIGIEFTQFDEKH